MTEEEQDRYENAIVGTGLLWAVLTSWGQQTPGRKGLDVTLIMDDEDEATNQLLVKFDIGGAPQERGYIVTVTVPDA